VGRASSLEAGLLGRTEHLPPLFRRGTQAWISAYSMESGRRGSNPRPSAWEVTAALGRVLSVAGGAAFLHRSWNAAEAEKDRFGRAVLT
jgi:hypothetical protein